VKRALPLLPMCGCAASLVKRTRPTPIWAGDEQVWIDPRPDASFGWSGNMESAARIV